MIPSYMNPAADGGMTCVLSPMAGFTNAPMRLFSLRHGARQVYTEMANAAGLAHEKSDATWQLLETLPGEGKIVAHLYGSDPADFAKAAEKVAATGRFCAIDINAGCPVPKVTCSGAGSELMRNPDLLGKIVAATRAASGLPVSVKTRIGFSPSEITVFRVLEEIEKAGAELIAVHARYKSQGHTGEVAYGILAEVKRRASISVFGNGGIRDSLTARAMIEKTGVDGLLIGQGAIGHPWVFEEIESGMEFPGGKGRSDWLELETIRKEVTAHLEEELEFVKHIAEKYPSSGPDETPEWITAVRFRCSLFRYLNGLRGVAFARGRMSKASSIADVMEIIDGCLECERRHRARRDEKREDGTAGI